MHEWRNTTAHFQASVLCVVSYLYSFWYHGILRCSLIFKLWNNQQQTKPVRGQPPQRNLDPSHTIASSSVGCVVWIAGRENEAVQKPRGFKIYKSHSLPISHDFIQITAFARTLRLQRTIRKNVWMCEKTLDPGLFFRRKKSIEATAERGISQPLSGGNADIQRIPLLLGSEKGIASSSLEPILSRSV